MTSRLIDALILRASAGDAEGARRHFAATCKADTPLAPVRAKLARACTPEAFSLFMKAMPWLAEDIFSVPAATPAEVDNLRAALTAAGAYGLRKDRIDPAALEALSEEVVECDPRASWRRRKKLPLTMVRLRVCDPQTNPFVLSVGY